MGSFNIILLVAIAMVFASGKRVVATSLRANPFLSDVPSNSNACAGITSRSACEASMTPDCGWCATANSCMDNATMWSSCNICAYYNETQCESQGICTWLTDSRLCVDPAALEGANSLNMVMNGNFELGTTDGWSPVGDPGAFTLFKYNGWKSGSMSGIFNKEGAYFLTTAQKMSNVGFVVSKPFTIQNSSLTMRLGGQNNQSVYVGLYKADTDDMLFQLFSTTNTFFMQTAEMNVTDYIGTKVYLKVVDESTTGCILVDAIRHSNATLFDPSGLDSTAGDASPPSEGNADFQLAKSYGANNVVFTGDDIFVGEPESNAFQTPRPSTALAPNGFSGWSIVSKANTVSQNCEDLITPVYCTKTEADSAATTCITTRVWTGYCALCNCCYELQESVLAYGCQHYKYPFCSECKETLDFLQTAWNLSKVGKKLWEARWSKAKFLNALKDIGSHISFCDALGFAWSDGKTVCELLSLNPEEVADYIVAELIEMVTKEAICKTLSITPLCA